MKIITRLFCLTMLLLPVTVLAAVKPHALLSDGAVLQCDTALPVWGTADDGEKVTVKFAGQSVSTTAKDGRWSVRLKPVAANATPQVMTIAGQNTVTISNLVVGEVWICSGQSNMQWALGSTANASNTIAAANDSLLRLFTVPRQGTNVPQRDVTGTWSECTSSNVARFSAVGYYFGRDVRAARKVPVGLINSSVGGTAAERWTSREALAAEPTLKAFLDGQEKAIAGYPAALEKYKAEEPALLEKYDAAVELSKKDGSKPPRKPAPPQNPSTSGVCTLYNAMIAPLQPFAMRGVIWYQGESNNGRAEQYKVLFPAMIRDWRKGWGLGEFPFLFVQIAPFKGMSPEIREAQFVSWQKTPNTAMAVITDYGEATNIHPQQKEPVGARLALAARALAYGEKLEYSGPVFDALKVDGAKAVVSFTHVGGGLVAKDGELKGFTISGTGTNFVSAEAKIDGDKIIVTGPEIEKPVAVRYGWSDVPEVNLYNKAGLPGDTVPDRRAEVAMSDAVKLIAGLRQAWRDEMASARNYRALAEREPIPERKAILLRLAEAEDKHAANWQVRLKDLGADPGASRESPKERARRWLLVQRGTEDAVLKLEQMEKDADALYDDLLKVCTDQDRAQIEEAQREEIEHAHVLSEIGGSGVPIQRKLDRLLHREKWHVTGGGWIGQAIYGANDGLGAAFGVVSGVAGATDVNAKFVLLSGIATAIASALSMGSGAYLATKSEREVYQAEIERERREIEENPEEELEEMELFYQLKGFSPKESKKMAAKLAEQPEHFLKTLAHEELGLSERAFPNPWRSSISATLSTAVGAFIPVIPYFWLTGMHALAWSFVISTIAHFAIGASKVFVTGRSWLKSGFEMTVVGLGEALITYGIGLLIAPAMR